MQEGTRRTETPQRPDSFPVELVGVTKQRPRQGLLCPLSCEEAEAERW